MTPSSIIAFVDQLNVATTSDTKGIRTRRVLSRAEYHWADFQHWEYDPCGEDDRKSVRVKLVFNRWRRTIDTSDLDEADFGQLLELLRSTVPELEQTADSR